MPPAEFAAGFGLQTPLVAGQLDTVRYSAFTHRAIDLLKRHLTSDTGYFDASGLRAHVRSANKAAALRASTVADVYAAVGEDHYVVLPCASTVNPGVDYEGTRLTLVAVAPEGFEFTIRTPSTPSRWAQYEVELAASFAAVLEAVKEYQAQAQAQAQALLLRRCLELYYYWVTFAPLSRGTAACGYVAMTAVVAAAGLRFTRPLPPGKQLDWEAILSPTPAVFLEQVLPWFEGSLQPLTRPLPREEVELLRTLRAVLFTLNCQEKS
jgi:hypothetical protein